MRPTPRVAKYHAAAAPSACGKTNFHAGAPEGFEGWKVTATIGDDTRDRRTPTAACMPSTPRRGYFGVAPGNQFAHQPELYVLPARDVISLNVALTDDGDAWWEGMEGHRLSAPEFRHRPAGRDRTPQLAKEIGAKAARPNWQAHGGGGDQQPGARPAMERCRGRAHDAFIPAPFRW